MPSIKTTHPTLMVSEVVSFSVVIYHTGGRPKLDAELLRRSVIRQLPDGTGVGPLVVTMHGQYVPLQDLPEAVIPAPFDVFATASRARWIAEKLKLPAHEAIKFLKDLERA